MLRTIALILLVAPLLTFAGDGKQPVPKNGRCPTGYFTRGSYCIPGKNARDVVVKVGQCPIGWYTRGGYCIRGK